MPNVKRKQISNDNNIHSENVPSMNQLKQTPRFKQIDNYNSKPGSARHNEQCIRRNVNKAMTPNKIILPKISKRKYKVNNTSNQTAVPTNINDNHSMHYIINNIHELTSNHLHKKKQLQNGASYHSYHNIFHTNTTNITNTHIVTNNYTKQNSNININESLIYQIKPPNDC